VRWCTYTQRVRRILTIEQDALLPGLGLFGLRLEASGAPALRLRTWEHDLSGLRAREFAAIVPLGGNAHAWEEDRHAFLSHERRLLAEAVDEGVPVLGICLGAQVLARALGAEGRDAGVHEAGWRRIVPTRAAERDPVLSHLERPAGSFQWHGDTFELPDGAELLASSASVANQAFRVGSAWGVQFHAEVDYPTFSEWIANHRDACREYGIDEEALHEEVRWGDEVDRGWRTRMFDSFIELALARA
jgi:GMP synthase (glutamine-hydrolysing)